MPPHLLILILETVFFIGLVGSLMVAIVTLVKDFPDLFGRH